MDTKINVDLQSFKSMILALVPDAQKLAQASLSQSKTGITAKSVDLARWVLEQYAKLVAPDIEHHAVHVVDHALLAQMEEAKQVMAEYNQHLDDNNPLDKRMGIGNN